jgi:uncharacterized GH25 family protein
VTLRSRNVGWLLPLLLAAPASAHEYWLAPSTYQAGARDTVAVTAFVGTGFRGERKPYAAPRTMRFTMHANRAIDLSTRAINGELEWSRVLTADDGGAVIVYESSFTPIELPAAEFDAYLRLEGLDEPLRARARLGATAGPGRERYARCPKTWIAGRDPSRVMKPLGLPIEIVPLDDPLRVATLRVRVLFGGRPLAGALLRAWHQPLATGATPLDAAARDSVGPVAQNRTNAQGIASVRVDRPGEWLLSAVHMTPSTDREVADWESRWASFTFARPAKP